jgi:hypothetical protein
MRSARLPPGGGRWIVIDGYQGLSVRSWNQYQSRAISLG